MMKTLGLTTIVLSALLLTGCGGGKGGDKKDSTTNQMKEKHGIIIFHNFPSDKCKDQNIINDFATEAVAKDVITSVESNDINCQYYGRENNINETAYYKVCAEIDTGLNLPHSCVYGFNDASNGGGISLETDLIIATTSSL